MKKQLLLTFDYELFMGRESGTVEFCLIKPTEQLLEISELYDLKYIFFVDTLYLKRMCELSDKHNLIKEDLSKITSQLEKIIEAGHYVFHHIHPHWIDAVYNKKKNEWDLSNNSKFSISNLNSETTAKVFADSDQILSMLYHKHKKPQIMGFRAGGLYAQPFLKYKTYMQKYGISIDFSVLRGANSVNRSYSFDYSQPPYEDIYKFEDDLMIKDNDGSFLEVVMNQFELKGVKKFINSIYYRINKKKESWKRFGDGASSGNKIQSKKRRDIFHSKETYSIELLNDFKQYLYFRAYKKVDFIHIISHPKLMSPSNIDSFKKMIKKMNEEYTIETNLFVIIKSNKITL